MDGTRREEQANRAARRSWLACSGWSAILVLAFAAPGCKKKDDKAALEAVDAAKKHPVVARKTKAPTDKTADGDKTAGGKPAEAGKTATVKPEPVKVETRPAVAPRAGEPAKAPEAGKPAEPARAGAAPVAAPETPPAPAAPSVPPAVAAAPEAGKPEAARAEDKKPDDKKADDKKPAEVAAAAGERPGAGEKPPGAGERPADRGAAGGVLRDRRGAEAAPAEAPEAPAPAPVAPAPVAPMPPAARGPGEPPLDVSGYISTTDLDLVLGKAAKLRRSELLGVPATPSYNALYFAPEKGDHFGVSVQVWRDGNLAESRTRFNTMRNTYSNVAPTNKVTEQGFRSFYNGLVTVVFADPRRPVVAAVSCSTKVCTADKLIALASRVAERLR